MIDRANVLPLTRHASLLQVREAPRRILLGRHPHRNVPTPRRLFSYDACRARWPPNIAPSDMLRAAKTSLRLKFC